MCWHLQGDELDGPTLEAYALTLRESLATTVGGTVPDDAWEQATLGLEEGGLGIRTPEMVALPAFVASRTTARAGAFAMFQAMAEAGFVEQGVLEARFDARTAAAEERLRNLCHSPAAADQVSAHVRAADDAANTACRHALSGRGVTPGRPTQPSDSVLPAEQHLHGVPKAPALQRQLCRVLDGKRRARLCEKWRTAGREEDAIRLEDLADSHQDHTWVGAEHPERGPGLSSNEWVTAIRLRLGLDFLASDRLCSACGKSILDTRCSHALCCAKGESTRGHNQVRNFLLAAFAPADPGAEAEVPGLAPSQPTWRPADILTTAAHPTMSVAVDVMVKCPFAAGAGQDCTEAGKREKLERYESILPELEAQGIRYSPAVFSAYGRRHPDVTAMLQEAARRAARHYGCADPSALRRRWERSLAIAVWCRVAAMVEHCLGSEETQRICTEADLRARDAAEAEAASRWQ